MSQPNMEDVYSELEDLCDILMTAESPDVLCSILRKIKETINKHSRSLNFDRLLLHGYFFVMYELLRKRAELAILREILDILCNLSATSRFLDDVEDYVLSDLIFRLTRFLPCGKEGFPYNARLVESSCWIFSNMLKDDRSLATDLFQHDIVERLVVSHNMAARVFAPDSRWFKTFYDFVSALLYQLETCNCSFIEPLFPLLVKALGKTSVPSTVLRIATAFANVFVTDWFGYERFLSALVDWTVKHCNSKEPKIQEAAVRLLRGISNLPDEYSDMLISSGILNFLPELLDSEHPERFADLLYVISNLCSTTQTTRISRMLAVGCFDRILNADSLEYTSQRVLDEHVRIFAALILNSRTDQLLELKERGMMNSLTLVLTKLGNKKYVFEILKT